MNIKFIRKFVKLLPLNSPSKKVNKNGSYINGFELIITQIFLRETYVKPKFLKKKAAYNGSPLF